MQNENSFRHAYESLPASKQLEVREKIKEALRIKDYAFYARMRGDVEPKVSEARKIETIFAEYGIVEVWNNN